MKLYNHIYLSAAALLSGLLTLSCSDESPVIDTTGSQDDVVFRVKITDGVSVQAGSRAGDEEETIFDRFPVGVDFREGKSRIRICSVDRNPSSDFFQPDYNNEYTIAEKKSHPNRYHEYICQTRRDYEAYSDFVSYDSHVPLQWDEIDEVTGVRKPNTGNILGTNIDGGFYLFAAMYPYIYERPVAKGDDMLAVLSDQKYDKALGKEYGHYAAKLLVNDIRLCQKFYGYDHFRMPIQLDFHHSLCQLVVNVKVPLHAQTDGLGFKIEEIAASWPPKMTMEQIGLHYRPRYDIIYGRNQAIQVDADLTDLDKIEMFHTPNFSNPDKTDPDSFTIEDCYYMGEEDYEGNTVPVLWMQFCAILPFQQLTDANTGANILFEIAGKRYRCYLSKINESVDLQQGHVTIVSMYIPRGESDPILVGAHLKDWENKRTPVVSLQ